MLKNATAAKQISIPAKENETQVDVKKKKKNTKDEQFGRSTGMLDDLEKINKSNLNHFPRRYGRRERGEERRTGMKECKRT